MAVFSFALIRSILFDDGIVEHIGNGARFVGSARKVGKFDRLASERDRLLGERGDAHPRNRVVYVDRHGFTLADGAEKPFEHDIVHAAVPAFDLFGRDVFPVVDLIV